MVTGLMTTAPRHWPITAGFRLRAMFVNDVMSVMQDGVNLCDAVYRRRRAPLSKCLCLFRWRIILLIRLGSRRRHCAPRPRVSPSSRSSPEPGRCETDADRQDGQRRVPHLHSGQHGHNFSGIGRRVHTGRYWWWVGYLFCLSREVDFRCYW